MATSADPLWYKDAVFYQLHVKSFADSNGDGIGDFPGLAARLDHVAALGVDCLWLQPMYPSPFKDDGYDISDYTSIHPSYGTLEDFERFLTQAHARGLRVIIELVLNHTSDLARLVRRSAQLERQSAPRLVRLERYGRPLPRCSDHLHRHGALELGVGPRVQVLLLASLLQSPTGPELRQSRRSARQSGT